MAATSLGLANPTQHVRVQNKAVVGQQQPASYAIAQANLNAGGIRFATWFPWSQNDGLTAAIIQGDYDTYVGAFVGLAHANGAIPVLLTAIPTGQLHNSTDDNARLSINTQLKALAAPDILIVDMDAVMSDGASPARIKSTLSDDAVHPNANGAAAMDAAFQSVLQTYLSTH